MSNYGLDVSSQGIQVILPYFELAMNWQAVAVIALAVTAYRFRQTSKGWNWTPKAYRLRNAVISYSAGLSLVGLFLYQIWAGWGRG